MAQSYKPYKPKNYASGEKCYDLYTVDLQDVMAKGGGSGNTFKFSNPFILLSVYSYYANRYLQLSYIFDVVISPVVDYSQTVSSVNPSGILFQQDNGDNTFNLVGTTYANKWHGATMFQQAPQMEPGITLFEDMTGPYNSGIYPYPINYLLNDFTYFDSIAVAPNTPFTISDPFNQPLRSLMLTMAVKRGDNQPFFTAVL